MKNMTSSGIVEERRGQHRNGEVRGPEDLAVELTNVPSDPATRAAPGAAGVEVVQV
ncbi:hypothetical protein ACFRMN_12555 [Streptomyces sp. NPDC056835]|uniref:hypothetical protein n=1 Tax=Streptomyces sp. NPDC056835 TaxID=3345956 RepID=UPI0036772964